jgi:quercetin dioxygenase-like cupin family protein
VSDAAWRRTLDDADAREVTDFGAVGVRALGLADGRDPWSATTLVFEAGGSLEAHVAGRDQIFLPLEGRGWLEVNGVRGELEPCSYGVVRAGQLHAKGATTRLVVLVLQSPVIHVVEHSPETADGVAPSATPSASSGPGEASPGLAV